MTMTTGRVPKYGVGGRTVVALTGTAGVRADSTIGINAAQRSLLEGLLNAAMGNQASELGVPRNG